ncbi:MAG: phage recombination protein Bet [Candidatus Thiodiazotropha sp. (ex Troendleina suluensis)]|nr:phage recombination protein Bet [Candidatus Thiodiazotropha sp. (ex Troendleina suluensis)]
MQQSNVTTIAEISRDKLVSVLQTSLYVGARAESVGMVIDYCSAAHLDPMQKPVHIVPMNTRNPISGDYEWRDVVMPGVGLYRIQADRSGSMAGISEPEFGKDMTQTFTDRNNNKVEMVYPEWCKVSVKKLVGNHIVEFIAKEYWLENYATDSGKSSAPNAMWRKRPRGQIAKCSEAQALRKGWPEIGQSPTAEEMDGKSIDPIDMGSVQVVNENEPVLLPEYPQDHFDNNFDKWEAAIKAGRKTPDQIIATISSKYTLSDEQNASIRDAGE